ncbi:MAG: putative 4-hydroxybenzoate polyprenyltransferase [Verrucomicrobiae bacterium]|nr:putative 4-hydroxybenzoate polyprenyltransferase [Verrucomicrobiae bacterium]
MLQKVKNILSFVRFSHTVFALPFALVAMLVAANGLPAFSVIIWILVCLVSARTAAMAFNRCADWEWDKQNPRTEGRHRLVSKRWARVLVCSALLIFVFGTWRLNLLCLLLSPVAVFLIFFYSLTKRFTAFSHFFLGLALATAPMGAWAGVTGSLLTWQPWILSLAVLLWVFGFDLIYATQDTVFDKKAGLYSFPVRYGNLAAFRLAQFLHGLAWATLAGFGLLSDLGWRYWIGWSLIGMALWFEHSLARSGDVKKINLAFFQVNAFVGCVLLLSVIFELWKS